MAKTIEEAQILANEKAGKTILLTEIKQDEDVLDTWFSSWVWPISVFNGLTDPGNKEIKYYYPTNDLVTAPEIMFFWVARMIIAGYEYMGELPFKNVYYTGIVRDKLGRKMSKSLGNSPDPIDLIEKYGADGVRMGVLISSPAGNDLPFDSSQCEQGRNFSNKIWNAFRLIKMWEVKDIEQPLSSIKAIEWFETKFNSELKEINESFDKFKISEALMTTYKLVWDDFCSWYLEMIKPGYEQPIDEKTYRATIHFFEQLLKIIQPFTPFIAEELWHSIKERNEDIIVESWPKITHSEQNLLSKFKIAEEIIVNIRNVRKQNNIANKVKMDLFVKKNSELDTDFDAVIIKMGNLSKLEYTNDKIANANSFMVKANEYYIPFGDSIDLEAEKLKIEQELIYTKGFLISVQKKLQNEKFVSGAPEQALLIEKMKETDAIQKIAILEEKLGSLV